ncbi:MAG: FecR domain-containing protein [Cyclobacteriaceae bacterium]
MEILITKQLAGEATADETAEITSWRSQNEANEAAFKKMQKAFELGQREIKQPKINIDIDAEWGHFNNLVAERSTKTVSIKPEQASRFSVMQLAASVALLIAVAIGYFYFADSTTTIQTADNIETVILPDGSQVELNRNTTLTYDDDFNSTSRNLTLDGEAFFDVKRNKSLPFVITSDQAEVKVLGTSFNVSAKGEGSVEVVVESGKVQLSDVSRNESVALNPGDKGLLTSTELLTEINDDPNFNAWSTKKLVFNNTELAEIVTLLNGVYGQQISLKTEVSDNCAATVTFDNQELDAVLLVLEELLGLVYQEANGQIEIIGAECQ